MGTLRLQVNTLLAFSIMQESELNCTEIKRQDAVRAHDILRAEAVKLRGRLSN